MQRVYESFYVAHVQQLKIKMLNWANRFNIFSFLDTHGYYQSYSAQACLLGAGAIHFISRPAGAAFDAFGQFQKEHPDWLFGHLAFDLKAETEQVPSRLPDGIGFEDLLFFVPEVVLQLKEDQLLIGAIGVSPGLIWEQINSCPSTAVTPPNDPIIEARFSREEYMRSVDQIREHIHRGDCYELNFCQEFFVESVEIDPVAMYHRLSQTSPNPFSALYKNDHRYLICASPERYLCKRGDQIFSQPIKGTMPRFPNDPEKDAQSKLALQQSLKERAENIMVVDLVRNDLSRICEQGTVNVEELCGIYSFPQVHQMISTVSGRVAPETSPAAILKQSFPMGSMTGAPKKRVLELTEQYERTRRGLFSGAVGYIEPGGDFDFNVVIRSILYNEETRYLSFQVGSAITFYADANAEYEECLLKAAAIKKVLTGIDQH